MTPPSEKDMARAKGIHDFARANHWHPSKSYEFIAAALAEVRRETIERPRTYAFGWGKVLTYWRKADADAQVQVEIAEVTEPHEINSEANRAALGAARPTTILGFNKLESIDSVIAVLQEARDELSRALKDVPR